MTQDEFNKTVIRTEDTVGEIWDLRPFEEQQSKAFECFLQDIDAQLRDGTLASEKRIIVLHDSRLVMSLLTLTRIKELQGFVKLGRCPPKIPVVCLLENVAGSRRRLTQSWSVDQSLRIVRHCLLTMQELKVL
jgi:hypothetical protein